MTDINKDFLKTYQFYTHKGQRISAFGKLNQKRGVLTIWICVCSTKDKFNKKQINKMFNEYIYSTTGEEIGDIHPWKFNVPADVNDYKHKFVNFMRDNYYVLVVPSFSLGNKIASIQVFMNSKTEPIVKEKSLKIKTMTASQKQLRDKFKEIAVTTPEDQQKHAEEFQNFYNGKAKSENPNLN